MDQSAFQKQLAALRDHRAAAPASMRQAFAADPQRFKTFSATDGDLLLDWSKCAVTAEMLDIACEVRPHDACLVPEKRAELTTEGGLDVAGHFEAVRAACKQLADVGVRVSLFIDPDDTQIRAAHEAGAPVIELHTGRYAEAHDEAEQQREYERIVAGVQAGARLGLKVNAGHGLHYTNVQQIAAIDGIVELNIGHAIVAHAIFAGWDNAVREMKAIMVAARVAALHGGAR